MNKNEVWEKAKLLLKDRNTDLSYKTWIEPLGLISIDEENECIYLSWSGQPKLINHINEYYLTCIGSVISECCNKKYKVAIKSASQLDVLKFINSRHDR